MLKKTNFIFFLCAILVASSNFIFSLADTEVKLDDELISQIEDVELYSVPQSKRSLRDDKEVMKLIEEYYLKEGVVVSNDIDDVVYQGQVKGVGTAFDAWDEETFDKVVEFVKYIDRYENIAINEEITRLLGKYNDGTLTEEEAYDLISMAPDKNIQYTIVSPEELEEDNATYREEDYYLDDIDEEVALRSLFSNGYNNIEARDYAYKWTKTGGKTRNTRDYGYYSTDVNDCANFVSQCLKAGGMKHKGTIYTSDKAWFYNNLKPSHTWGGAANFGRHWKNRASVSSNPRQLKTGDVVQIDFEGDGHMDHTMIITKNTSNAALSSKYLTQHTPDRKETFDDGTPYTLNYLYNKYDNIVGYEMDKADN